MICPKVTFPLVRKGCRIGPGQYQRRPFCVSDLRFRLGAKIQHERVEPVPLDSGVLPTVPDRLPMWAVPDRGVGDDLVTALPCPLAEGVVLGKIPSAVILSDEASNRRTAPLVCDCVRCTWEAAQTRLDCQVNLLMTCTGILYA